MFIRSSKDLRCYSHTSQWRLSYRVIPVKKVELATELGSARMCSMLADLSRVVGCHTDACKLGSAHSKYLKTWRPSWKGGSAIVVTKQNQKHEARSPNPHLNVFSPVFTISDISVETKKENTNKQEHMRQAGSSGNRSLRSWDLMILRSVPT